MFLCLENTASSKNFPAGTFIFSMRYQHLSLFFVTSVLSYILPVCSLSYQVRRATKNGEDSHQLLIKRKHRGGGRNVLK